MFLGADQVISREIMSKNFNHIANDESASRSENDSGCCSTMNGDSTENECRIGDSHIENIEKCSSSSFVEKLMTDCLSQRLISFDLSRKDLQFVPEELLQLEHLEVI